MPRPPRIADGATGASIPKRPAAKKQNGHVPNNDDAVSRKAYEIYQSRGGDHGRDLDDWFEAEKQLRSSVPPKAPRKTKTPAKPTS